MALTVQKKNLMKAWALSLLVVLSVVTAFGSEGFFRISQESGGRWRVIGPDGNETVPLGVCLVRYDGCTNRGGPRRYRDWNDAHFPSREAWAADTVEKLKAWGFNRIGGGDAVLHGRGLMYSVEVCFSGPLCGLGQSQEKWICPNPGRPCAAFPNVFHPDFRKWCDETARVVCQPLRDDRDLFGYYTDNELAWWGRGARNTAAGLYDVVLKLPTGHAARQAAERIAAERGVAPDEAPVSVKLEFLRAAAEIYFRETRAAILAVDPNHMVLGARFAGLNGAHEVVWETAGKYSDLVTFNIYPWADLDRNAVFLDSSPNAPRMTEVFAERYAIVKKPFLITEWSFPALDVGLPCTCGAGQRFRTQDERTRASELFARTMLASPYVVGYDYFMWVDEPPEGVRDAHPEDTNYGLVSEQGEPYPITRMFARLHADLPAVIAAGVPAERPAPPPERGVTSSEMDVRLAKTEVNPEAALRFPEPQPKEGCVIEGVTCANRPLGAFSIMLSYLDAGKPQWVCIERTVSATKGDDGRWTVVAESTAGRFKFEFTLELTFYKDAPFFLADVVRLRNVGSEPIDVQAVYFKAVSPFARESADKAEVPNRWKAPKAAYWRSADGRWFGLRSDAATADKFVFRYDKDSGRQHPDAVFRPRERLVLSPGEMYEPKGTMWTVVEGGIKPVSPFNQPSSNDGSTNTKRKEDQK